MTRGRDAFRRALRWSDRLPLDPDVDANVDEATHHRRVLLLVLAGGCVGGLVRYLALRHWPEPSGGFPWATFGVNVAGAFLLAVVVVVATEHLVGSRYLRPLLGTGFCGALTTFSSIVVSVDRLAAHGHVGLAVTYLLATVVAGLVAGALGLAATRATVR